MSPRLEDAVAAWLERVHAGDTPDVAAFATEHGVSVAELQPLLDNARWLVGRHREQQPGHRLPTPPFDVGDFRALEEAGRGGMGVVFRGVHRTLGRPVAIKVLGPARQAAGTRSRVRFVREAQAAARLSHPGIVAVLAVGEAEDFAWFAMEWIEGESLAQVLARGRGAGSGRTAPREAAQLIARVADALHHAHTQGLLHRDVKPGNILVDRDGAPHLADFGLVRDLADTGLTATGEVLGSPPYMSPEQVRGERKLTPRTDVYSLGVTLYECLTLRRPFTADDTATLRTQILAAAVAAPRAGDADVPAELQWVCLRAMAREVDVRYPSAAAFAADLEAFLRGEPVQAGPPSSALRIRRALRRHRRKLVLGGVLLAAGSLLAWGWRARVDLVRAELAATHGRVALARISEDRNSWLRALNVAMAQHPDEPAFLVQRAIVWLALNRAADATRDVAAAHALRPDDGELTELVHALGAAARIAAADAASADDLAAVKKIARAGGERAEFLHLRGVLLGFLGRWDEAEPLLQRVRVLDRSFGVESDLMVTNLRLGRPQQALAELERFTAARPVPSVVCVRCRVLATLGDWAGARVERDRLTQLAPASAYAAAARIMLAPVPGADVDVEAEVARAQRAPDWEEAQDAVQRAAGAAHHLRREPAPAIAAYTAVLARDPQDPKLHSLLGICCFELAESQTGDERADTLRRGRAALAAAARLSRHLPFEADYHAGMLAFYDKRYADAVAHLRRAAQQAPADPKRQRPLGFALAMLVNVTRDPRERVALIEECVAVHRRECELAPNDARATMLLRNALEFLAHSLQRLDDPRAAEVAREAAALATEPRR